jgi:hypothetical protein
VTLIRNRHLIAVPLALLLGLTACREDPTWAKSRDPVYNDSPVRVLRPADVGSNLFI